MSLIGKSTLSFRKKDVLEQKVAGSPHKRLVFAHKASAGETGINLTTLVQPSEMASLGFTNPNTAELLAGKMLFYKKNLTVISSSKGLLMQDLSYTVPTNQRIAFQGFTADQDEIFICTLESEVKDGLQVVDSGRIVATGILAAGDVQFNVGVPFQVGKYISQQVGSVMVFLDGVQQFRNTANSDTTLDANYFEIDAGGGLGNIIEFNAVDNINDRSVLVVGEITAERPNGSMMAVVESLAGQMDQVIPTVAALAGQPETNFQAQPNNVDLKGFGDRVLQAEEDIDNLEVTKQDIITKEIAIITSSVSAANNIDTLFSTLAASKDTLGGTSLNRYTFQNSGTFLITIRQRFNNLSTNFRGVQYSINGGGVVRIFSGPGVASTNTTVESTVVMDVSASDYIEFRTQQATGGNETVDLFASVVEIERV